MKNVVLINPSFPDNDHSGALIGKLDKGTAMNCYAYGTGDLIEVQQGNPTVTNVGRARKVTPGDGVTVSPAATDIANGFVYNNENYYREGLALTLSSNATAPTGYTHTYSVNGAAIWADLNYTFSWCTPADRITIGATSLYATARKTATFTRLFTDGTATYTGTLTGTDGNGTDIENPVFTGVTVSGNTPTPVTCADGRVAFVGNFGPVTIGSEDDKKSFYLADDNTLCWPSGATTINAQRARFVLNAPNTGVGDLNGDGEVTADDIPPLVDVLLGKTAAYDHTAADATGDQQMTLADLTALVNFIHPGITRIVTNVEGLGSDGGASASGLED